MTRTQATRKNLEEIRAQYLVCSQLIRACRQAVFEIALDETDDPAVRRRAVESLKAVLGDWTEAQKWLRSEIARRNGAPSFTRR